MIVPNVPAMVSRIWLLAVVLFAVCSSLMAQTVEDLAVPSAVQTPVEYPPAAVSAGEEGTVMVALEVDANGRVRDARIHESSGYPRLDEAALRSVSRWIFRPAARDGEPVAQRVQIPVAFQLEEGAGASDSPLSVARMIGPLLGLAGGLVWLAGFVWSIVLAKRVSILWLSGMVALWIVTYPVFVALHWSLAKRSLAVVLAGVSLWSLGFYLGSSG